MSWKERVSKTGEALAGIAGQIIFSATISVLFILSGYASRTGVQSLTMLSISTGLMASRFKGDAKVLGYGACALIAGGALVLAFGLPRGAPLAWPLTLAIGCGSWVVVGVILLLRGKPADNLAARRPDAWTWLVGSATWLGISLTYGNRALVVRAGKLGGYLWVPWASVGFLVSAWVLPRLVARRWPKPIPTALRWAGGMARGVVMGLAIGFLVTLVLAQMGAPGVASASYLQAPPCSNCDLSKHLIAVQAYGTPNGTLVAAAFGAPPTGLILHFQGLNESLELKLEAQGWSVLGNGRDIDGDTLSVTTVNNTLMVLLQDRAYWRPLAAEGPDGTKLPDSGFFEPRALPARTNG